MSDKSNEIVAKTNWQRIGITALILAFFVSIAVVSIAYFQLFKANITLADQVSGLEQRSSIDQHQLEKLHALTAGLQHSMAQSQMLSNKQEQLIAEWQSAQKGDLSKWYLAEAQYLIRMANDNAQYAANISSAVVLLQRAAQLLGMVNQAQAVEVRQSLITDITRLQAVSQANVTNLYLQLATLNEQLDKLPLPTAPLSQEVAEKAGGDEGIETYWWQRGLARSWEALRQIIIVRQLTVANHPLVLPEEKMLLKQGLHAKLESAMWAVLHHDDAIYQNSLSSMQAWIAQYYDQSAQETQMILQQIETLRKINIQVPSVNLSATLELLDKYVAPARTT